MANEKWNLNTTADLTAEPGTPEGLTNWPPVPAQARVDARPNDYGRPPRPPAPLWFTDGAQPTPNPIPGGQVTPTSIQLFWRSNVGEIPKGSKMPPLPPATGGDATNSGSKGVDSAGLDGHFLTITSPTISTAPRIRLVGPEVTTIISGFWYPNPNPGPDVPAMLWEPIKPGTAYTIKIRGYNSYVAFKPADPKRPYVEQEGDDSAPLTVTTPAADPNRTDPIINPTPPADVALSSPMALTVGSTQQTIYLRWVRVNTATKYEVWDNNTISNTSDLGGMDPARPGLMLGDRKLADVPQPTDPTDPNYYVINYRLPAYTTPGQPYALKVRAVRDPGGGRPITYSDFSPVLRGTVPDATSVPSAPLAPALTETPVVGGLVKLTINPGPVDASHGPAAYYNVLVGGKVVGTVRAPLGAPPHFTYQAPPGDSTSTISVTIVAGNSLGATQPGPALSVPIPAAAVPAKVTGLKLDGIVTATTVPIMWDAISMSPPVTSYTVKDGTTVKATTGNNFVTLTGYTVGQQYSITVLATNAKGDGPPSDALTGATSGPPPAPQNLALDPKATTASIPIKWDTVTASPAVTAYRVFDGSVFKTQVTPISGNTQRTTLTGYNPGQTYNLTVTAVNSSGESPASTALTGKIPAVPPAPAKPTLGTPSQPAPGKINVVWTAVTADPPVTGYNVYDGATKKAGPITGLNSDVTGTAGQPYQISIAAINDAGEGPKSSPTLDGTYPSTLRVRAPKDA
ncbi:fibronectin type III domain-containing protein [Streptomyces roseifaciens]